jgi:hypothetical protein
MVAWGRLGANAGAIFTVGGAGAVAVLLATPGRASVRRVGLALAAVLCGLAALAGLDLATGGGAHFTREVIHAQSLSALLDTLWRRAREAWLTVATGGGWIAVIACLAAAGYVVGRRRTVLAPAGEATAWTAALGGGFAGSLLGALTADSGARLLFVGSFMLACVLAYLHGGPDLAGGHWGERSVHFLSNASRRREH